MLPVVKGVPETARQIALYTLLLVAISLVFFAVARMGAIYLVAAVVLGAIFLWRAYRLLRQSGSPEGSLDPVDPPVQVLDLVPDAAVRRRRGGQPRARPPHVAARTMDAPGRGPARRNDRPAPGATAVLRDTVRPSLVALVAALLLVALALASSLVRPAPCSRPARRPRSRPRTRSCSATWSSSAPSCAPRTRAAGRPSASRSAGRARAASPTRSSSAAARSPAPRRRPIARTCPAATCSSSGTRTASSPTTGARGTQAWTDELAPLRPPGVTPAATELPTDPLGSINPGTLAAVAGLLFALLIAIVAYLYVLRARRRPPDWIR